MHRLFFICLCATLLGCTPSAETVVKTAISAADEDNLEDFVATLDKESAAFIERARAAGETLPPDWIWMEGSPSRILAGSSIASKDEVSDSVTRFTLSAPSSEITELWVLKSDDGLFPAWQIHLLGSKGLITPLRLVKR